MSSIAAAFDCGSFTHEQVMVAIFNSNPKAFPTRNMNLILADEILVIPRQKVIGKTSAAKAREQVETHSNTFDGQ